MIAINRGLLSKSSLDEKNKTVGSETPMINGFKLIKAPTPLLHPSSHVNSDR